MILNDKEIQALGESGFISPYVEHCVRAFMRPGSTKITNAMSYGQSSYGYDVSLKNTAFKLFNSYSADIIDPKVPSENTLLDAKIHHNSETGESYVILPPHSYGLGSTKEYFRIPRDIMIICVGKSTYARHGIIINVTPIEPGFEGEVVIEIANTTPLPAKIYLDEGIAQFIFFRGNPAEVSYKDRNGKYQGQTGIRLGQA